jgi:hypothetical protein
VLLTKRDFSDQPTPSEPFATVRDPDPKVARSSVFCPRKPLYDPRETAMSAEQEQHDGGDDGGEVENADSNAEFKPVVELPSEHTVQTGEEEDEVVYKQLRIVQSF